MVFVHPEFWSGERTPATQSVESAVKGRTAKSDTVQVLGFGSIMRSQWLFRFHEAKHFTKKGNLPMYLVDLAYCGVALTVSPQPAIA